VAIKGKGRTKSRPPARAPKRAPVEVPVPFAKRRWVQAVAAFLLGLGVAWFLIWLTNGLRDQREDERIAAEQVEQRRGVQSWQQLVDAEVASIGQVGPAGVPPQIAGELGPILDQIADGQPEGTRQALTSLVDRLEASIETLEDFDLAGAITDRGFDIGTANSLTNSQGRLVAALRLFTDSARLGLVATGLEDDDARRSVARRAQDIRIRGDETLADAWREYTLGLGAVGLQPASQDPTAGGGFDLGDLGELGEQP
jgi:hypothetical protein